MSTVNELFVTASRKKFRFNAGKGYVTVDDLWDLPLASLDTIAVDLDDKIQKLGRKSFVKKRETSTNEVELQLDVVKFVIETKLAEDEARKTKAAKDAQKAFLNNLLEEKKIDQLKGLSVEEIQAQLQAL